MSRVITEADANLGYSSEPDDYDGECNEQLDENVGGNPSEVYIGNVGDISASKLYDRFAQAGNILNMIMWRSYGTLYHARIAYTNPTEARKAKSRLHGDMLFERRLRVTLVKERIMLNYNKTLRLEGLGPQCSEEDVYAHFAACGPIDSVIRTGFAVYVLFETTGAIPKALQRQQQINGEPYTVRKLSGEDRINHQAIIENLKVIKQRKPYVVMENFPRLDASMPLCTYKQTVERGADCSIEHFKIAANGTDTVSLAFCCTKRNDRDNLLSSLSDKKITMYESTDVISMNKDSLEEFVDVDSTIVVRDLPPYFGDYEVCQMFKKCGDINFVEKMGSDWIVCYCNRSAMKLLQVTTFKVNRNRVQVERISNDNCHNLKLPFKADKQKKPEVPPLMDPSEFKPKTNQGAANVKGGKESSTSHDAEAQQAEAVALKRKAMMDSPITCEFPIDQDDRKYQIYVGNLPKGTTEANLRQQFGEDNVRHVRVLFSESEYQPTACAMLTFTRTDLLAKVLETNHQNYRGKRLYVCPFSACETFDKNCSVMVRNLTHSVTEEQLLQEIAKHFGPDAVLDVYRPAYHYAYVDFKADNVKQSGILQRLCEAFNRFQLDVTPLLASIPKRMYPMTKTNLVQFLKQRQLKQVAEIEYFGTEFGMQRACELFVGNIPRESMAEDVIAYFNLFGDVTDYQPVAKGSCQLRKSAIITFATRSQAERALCYYYHYFEGSLLDVHLMMFPPLQFKSITNVMTMKTNSEFLTLDEVRDRLSKFAEILYGCRFDAFNRRKNFVFLYKLRKTASKDDILHLKHIFGEPVQFVNGLDLTPANLEELPADSSNVANNRDAKTFQLKLVLLTESQKELIEPVARSLPVSDVPTTRFYNETSIQINNAPLNVTPKQLRQFFLKIGDISNCEMVILEEDQSKICFVQFKKDLSAHLACNYNQRMMDGKRLVIHLATETICIEQDRSVLVDQLHPNTTAEDVHDAFSTVGAIKYVQKQSVNSAVVCFAKPDSLPKAKTVRNISKSPTFIVGPVYDSYNHHFYKRFTTRVQKITEEQLRNQLTPAIRSDYLLVPTEPATVIAKIQPELQERLVNFIYHRFDTPAFVTMNQSQQIDFLMSNFQNFAERDVFATLPQDEQRDLLLLAGKVHSSLGTPSKRDTDNKRQRLNVAPPQQMVQYPVFAGKNWNEAPNSKPPASNNIGWQRR